MTNDQTPTPTVRPTIHGYPRQGDGRRLKKAVEGHWRGEVDAETLLSVAAGLRRERLQTMADAGIGEVPVGDFSLYDHVLDTTLLLGAPPARFTDLPGTATPTARLATLFALARGTDQQPPLEMTKWFDTNYHYLVPELDASTTFTLDPEVLLEQVAEARELGLEPRPVLVGPVTYLLLAKPADPGSGFDPLSLLDPLVGVYAELLGRLADAGVEWVQLDEPALVQDQPAEVLQRLDAGYRRLAAVERRPRLLVASYFGELGAAARVLAGLPVEGLAVDLTATAGAATAEANLAALAGAPGLTGKRLLAGVVDGRSVWRTDLDAALRVLDRVRPLVGRLDVSSSCSLLHLPLDLDAETSIDPGVASWLAFARQKLDEVVTLATGAERGREAIADQLGVSAAALASRRASALAHRADVRDRVAAVGAGDTRRDSPSDVRLAAQQEHLGLPLLPTTTIGSFPQTTELRTARAALRRGELDQTGYEAAMRTEIDRVLALQTDLGVDVLVHGEPERNDMVQYFAELLDGFLTTEQGWVQSYGSRYVRPPIVVGDVARPTPMTVGWSSYAREAGGGRPVKGMLTGPVTMLAWSFGRDDLGAADTATQIALALREEVLDLERAGIDIIQVDEPALRETLPLRAADRPAYLDWAVRAFQLTTAGVADRTQVHTHMCYAEFGEIMAAITAMDADVISLEASRSRMEVVADLTAAHYPNAVGPGVWDIHSPRVPSVAEVVESLTLALDGGVPPERLWVNPDCGLKTRRYIEVEPSLKHLVEGARIVRERLAAR